MRFLLRKPQSVASPPGAVMAIPSLPVVVETTLSEVSKGFAITRRYTVDVYCCNCSPAFHFDAAIPAGILSTGCRVQCPNCEVWGFINEMHQVWPYPPRR
mgnify:CR=1 FL=1